MKIKDILLPTLALTIICAVLGAALAGTNAVTKDPIAEQEAQKQQEAMKAALPAYEYKKLDEKDGCVIYEAIQEIRTGYVVSSHANGYGGRIDVMVGIDLGGKVYGIEIVSADDETAGIGQKVKEDDFKIRFRDKKADQIDDVAVITGASISSRAVKTAVKTAVETWQSMDYKIGGDAQ